MIFMMNNKMQRAASLTPKPIGDIISSPISHFLFFGFFFCEPKAPQDTRVSPEPQQTKEITLLPLPPLFSVITTPPDRFVSDTASETMRDTVLHQHFITEYIDYNEHFAVPHIVSQILIFILRSLDSST